MNGATMRMISSEATNCLTANDAFLTLVRKYYIETDPLADYVTGLKEGEGLADGPAPEGSARVA